jgi:hypothetical protein
MTADEVRTELAALLGAPVLPKPVWSEQAVAWARALLDAHVFAARLDLSPASHKFARTVESMRLVGAPLGVLWERGASTWEERLVSLLVTCAEARAGNRPAAGDVWLEAWPTYDAERNERQREVLLRPEFSGHSEDEVAMDMEMFGRLFLCLHCLSVRLKRPLRPTDFVSGSRSPCNRAIELGWAMAKAAP